MDFATDKFIVDFENLAKFEFKLHMILLALRLNICFYFGQYRSCHNDTQNAEIQGQLLDRKSRDTL